MNTLLNTNIYAAALIIIILSYLAGSINGAMIVSLFFGSDIRKKGSKNAGATNVYRHHGFLPALFTALFDFFKGFIPAFYLPGLIYCGKVFTIITFYQESGLIGQGLDSQTAGVIWKLAFLSGLASIAGHIFPLFHSFKGGKGVATAAGLCAVIFPEHILWVTGAFIMALLIHKTVFPASITGVVSLAALTAAERIYSVQTFSPFRTTAALIICVIILLSHKNNFNKKGPIRR